MSKRIRGDFRATVKDQAGYDRFLRLKNIHCLLDSAGFEIHEFDDLVDDDPYKRGPALGSGDSDAETGHKSRKRKKKEAEETSSSSAEESSTTLSEANGKADVVAHAKKIMGAGDTAHQKFAHDIAKRMSRWPAGKVRWYSAMGALEGVKATTASRNRLMASIDMYEAEAKNAQNAQNAKKARKRQVVALWFLAYDPGRSNPQQFL